MWIELESDGLKVGYRLDELLRACRDEWVDMEVDGRADSDG